MLVKKMNQFFFICENLKKCDLFLKKDHIVGVKTPFLKKNAKKKHTK